MARSRLADAGMKRHTGISPSWKRTRIIIPVFTATSWTVPVAQCVPLGAAMKWFLRLTSEGVGMHIGILPGYPASHGCIRESVDGAKLLYDYAKVGTSIDVGDF